MIEKIDYHGWASSYRLSNGHIELCATADVGPRIVDFRPAGGHNVFHLRPEELGSTGEPHWVLRGGWRLWVAPETRAITYVPDNSPCRVETDGAWRLRLTAPALPAAPLQKSIEIRMAPNHPRVNIGSTLTNVGAQPVRCAAWSLSVLRPGGRALIPLDTGDRTAFADVRRLILWSYASWTDARYRFGDSLVQVDHRHIRTAPATSRGRRPDESKIGVDSAQGWAAYLNDDVLYLKRFAHVPGASYPDGGSTIEVYSSTEFLELENLSPLATLAPGDELTYQEKWLLAPPISLEEGDSHILDSIAALW